MNTCNNLCQSILEAYRIDNRDLIDSHVHLLRKDILDNRYGYFDRKFISSIQKVYSLYEVQQEKSLADRLLSGHITWQDITKNLWFYKFLVRRDWNTLSSCTYHSSHDVLFIGDGSMPMTAILLAQMYKVRTTILECDLEAVQLSKEVVKSLGLDTYITIVPVLASEYGDYGEHNTFFLSSFLSYNITELESVLSYISLYAENPHVLGRTVSGKAELFYRPLVDIATYGFSYKHTWVIDKRVVNEIRIFSL